MIVHWYPWASRTPRCGTHVVQARTHRTAEDVVITCKRCRELYQEWMDSKRAIEAKAHAQATLRIHGREPREDLLAPPEAL